MHNELLPKIQAFFKRNGMIVAAALLFLFFMGILVFSYMQTPTQSSHSATPFPTSVNARGNSASSDESGNRELQEDETNMVAWSQRSVSDNDFGDIKTSKTTLSDGSIKYTYASDTQTRPTIIIVKNGINIFQRVVMHNTQMDPNAAPAPDYISTGSKFWGNNVITKIYLSKGYAYVLDPNTNMVLEEMTFQPTTLEVFRTYDDDILGDAKKF